MLLHSTDGPRTTVAWHKVYLVLTAVSAVLLGLTSTGVLPAETLGPIATAGLIVALFAIASVAYWWDVNRWRRRNNRDPPDFAFSLDEEIPYVERENHREVGFPEEDEEIDEAAGTDEARESDETDGPNETDESNAADESNDSPDPNEIDG